MFHAFVHALIIPLVNSDLLAFTIFYFVEIMMYESNSFIKPRSQRSALSVKVKFQLHLTPPVEQFLNIQVEVYSRSWPSFYYIKLYYLNVLCANKK